MRRANRSWMAVVAAGVLLGTLVGVVWARPNDGPQAADITRKVTLAGSDFIPASDTEDWGNSGFHVRCESGVCGFTATVVFPCLPSVTVERMKLHVYDYNATQSTCATLFRTYPTTGATVQLGAAASPEGGSGGLQTYTNPNINKVVWPSQKAYIYLVIGGPNIHVDGVTVEYHKNT